MKLSLVTVVSRIHDPEPGAASLRLASVEQELLRRRIPVRVLTSRAPQPESQELKGLKVSRWPVLRAKDGQLRGYLPYMSFDIPLALRVPVDPPADVYLVEPPPTTGAMMRVVSALIRRPYVYYAADIWSDAAGQVGAPSIVAKIVRRLESFAMKGAAQVIAVSEGVADRVRTLGASRIVVVPNGIDTTIFTPDQEAISEAERIGENVVHPYFIYAGTTSEWHGAEIFVEAMAHVKDNVQLVFLGHGSAWERIKKRAEKLSRLPDGSPRVVLLERQSPEVAAAWQAGASAALVSLRPGKGYDFAYPTKALSALACGLPVLYTGVGPLKDDLRDPLLGRAVEYDISTVAAAMEDLAAVDSREHAQYRFQWVVDNRSAKTVGEQVANILQSTAKARF